MLPPALIDLTLAQVASRWPRTPRTAVRYLSQAYKLNVQPRTAWTNRDEKVALSSRPIPPAESSRLFPRLSVSGKQKPWLSEDGTPPPAELSELHEETYFDFGQESLKEEDLVAIYRDLLKLESPDSSVPRRLYIPNPDKVLPRLESRFLNGHSQASASPTQDGGLATKLQSLIKESDVQQVQLHNSAGRPYSAVLNNLQELVTASLPQTLMASPIGVMTTLEWASLVQACLDHQDMEGLFATLHTMKALQHPPTKEICELILRELAKGGRFNEVQEVATIFMREMTDTRQAEFLMTAMCNARLYHEACDILHQYELEHQPLPIAAYHAVITGLIKSPSPNAPRRALAWDMFAHMRYVAHPTPSKELYATMIAACAKGSEPDAERASDLFIEMTVDKKLEPTTEAYAALISVYAKTKATAVEAFRMASQMVDVRRDADGMPLLRPNRAIWMSLLEAAKRLGDLQKTHWLLTQMGKEQLASPSHLPPLIDDWVMRHIFHAYSAYRPPFRREYAPLKSREGVDETSERSKVAPAEEVSVPGKSVNRYILPQTSHEVLQEAETLFAQILAQQQTENTLSDSASIFRGVRVTSHLLNAYLGVHFSHSASTEQAVAKIFDLHSQFNVDISIETVLKSLQRIGNAKTVERTPIILEIAEKLWARFQNVLQGLSEGATDMRWVRLLSAPPEQTIGEVTKNSISASDIARSWSAMIRVHTLWNNLEGALSLVREIQERYPPDMVSENLNPDLQVIVSKPGLEGPRPLVRLSERGLVNDDSVPPALTFADIEILHHRLTTAGPGGEPRRKDIDYLTWLTSTYAGRLKDRRGMNLLVEDVGKYGWDGTGTEVAEKVKERNRLKARWRSKWEKGLARLPLARR